MTLTDPLALEAEVPPQATAEAGRARLVFRRFRRNRLALVGAAVVALLFLAAYVGPYLLPWKYTDLDYNNFATPPSGTHWFGTMQTGQDLLALTLRGLQKSLIIGLLSGALTTVVAAVVGAFAGYFGGWTERILMWITDLFLVLPGFMIVAILSPFYSGRTWLFLVLMLAAFTWMITARIVRSWTLTLKNTEYALAAKYMGVSGARIIFRHILPNISSLLIVDMTINVSLTVLGEAGLSFFGLGIQPPDVSLGTLIGNGQSDVESDQWLFFFPALMLLVLVLSVNLIGDGMRDALDPTSSSAKAR
jgi:peptide/nickel transport system permease protein